MQTGSPVDPKDQELFRADSNTELAKNFAKALVNGTTEQSVILAYVKRFRFMCDYKSFFSFWSSFSENLIVLFDTQLRSQNRAQACVAKIIAFIQLVIDALRDESWTNYGKEPSKDALDNIRAALVVVIAPLAAAVFRDLSFAEFKFENGGGGFNPSPSIYKEWLLWLKSKRADLEVITKAELQVSEFPDDARALLEYTKSLESVSENDNNFRFISFSKIIGAFCMMNYLCRFATLIEKQDSVTGLEVLETDIIRFVSSDHSTIMDPFALIASHFLGAFKSNPVDQKDPETNRGIMSLPSVFQFMTQYFPFKRAEMREFEKTISSDSTVMSLEQLHMWRQLTLPKDDSDSPMSCWIRSAMFADFIFTENTEVFIESSSIGPYFSKRMPRTMYHEHTQNDHYSWLKLSYEHSVQPKLLTLRGAALIRSVLLQDGLCGRQHPSCCSPTLDACPRLSFLQGISHPSLLDLVLSEVSDLSNKLAGSASKAIEIVKSIRVFMFNVFRGTNSQKFRANAHKMLQSISSSTWEKLRLNYANNGAKKIIPDLYLVMERCSNDAADVETKGRLGYIPWQIHFLKCGNGEVLANGYWRIYQSRSTPKSEEVIRFLQFLEVELAKGAVKGSQTKMKDIKSMVVEMVRILSQPDMAALESFAFVDAETTLKSGLMNDDIIKSYLFLTAEAYSLQLSNILAIIDGSTDLSAATLRMDIAPSERNKSLKRSILETQPVHAESKDASLEEDIQTKKRRRTDAVDPKLDFKVNNPLLSNPAILNLFPLVPSLKIDHMNLSYTRRTVLVVEEVEPANVIDQVHALVQTWTRILSNSSQNAVGEWIGNLIATQYPSLHRRILDLVIAEFINANHRLASTFVEPMIAILLSARDGGKDSVNPKSSRPFRTIAELFSAHSSDQHEDLLFSILQQLTTRNVSERKELMMWIMDCLASSRPRMQLRYFRSLCNSSAQGSGTEHKRDFLKHLLTTAPPTMFAPLVIALMTETGELRNKDELENENSGRPWWDDGRIMLFSRRIVLFQTEAIVRHYFSRFATDAAELIRTAMSAPMDRYKDPADAKQVLDEVLRLLHLPPNDPSDWFKVFFVEPAMQAYHRTANHKVRILADFFFENLFLPSETWFRTYLFSNKEQHLRSMMRTIALRDKDTYNFKGLSADGIAALTMGIVNPCDRIARIWIQRWTAKVPRIWILAVFDAANQLGILSGTLINLCRSLVTGFISAHSSRQLAGSSVQNRTDSNGQNRTDSSEISSFLMSLLSHRVLVVADPYGQLQPDIKASERVSAAALRQIQVVLGSVVFSGVVVSVGGGKSLNLGPFMSAVNDAILTMIQKLRLAPLRLDPASGKPGPGKRGSSGGPHMPTSRGDVVVKTMRFSEHVINILAAAINHENHRAYFETVGSSLVVLRSLFSALEFAAKEDSGGSEQMIGSIMEFFRALYAHLQPSDSIPISTTDASSAAFGSAVMYNYHRIMCQQHYHYFARSLTEHEKLHSQFTDFTKLLLALFGREHTFLDTIIGVIHSISVADTTSKQARMMLDQDYDPAQMPKADNLVSIWKTVYSWQLKHEKTNLRSTVLFMIDAAEHMGATRISIQSDGADESEFVDLGTDSLSTFALRRNRYSAVGEVMESHNTRLMHPSAILLMEFVLKGTGSTYFSEITNAVLRPAATFFAVPKPPRENEDSLRAYKDRVAVMEAYLSLVGECNVIVSHETTNVQQNSLSTFVEYAIPMLLNGFLFKDSELAKRCNLLFRSLFSISNLSKGSKYRALQGAIAIMRAADSGKGSEDATNGIGMARAAVEMMRAES
ncbi:hypothetical protein BJ742DRAFT_542137 [Cladochytrium replicatum]|nr:hypothetical protein BJ742DRAFT_542137 [Cladochytrium replicatum]